MRHREGVAATRCTLQRRSGAASYSTRVVATLWRNCPAISSGVARLLSWAEGQAPARSKAPTVLWLPLWQALQQHKQGLKGSTETGAINRWDMLTI